MLAGSVLPPSLGSNPKGTVAVGNAGWYFGTRSHGELTCWWAKYPSKQASFWLVSVGGSWADGCIIVRATLCVTR